MIAAALAALALAPGASAPFHYDALGPMRDVTTHWQAYQPASTFCVKPETDEYTPGGIGPTVTGANPGLSALGLLAGHQGARGYPCPHAHAVLRLPEPVHRLRGHPGQEQAPALLPPRPRLLPARVIQPDLHRRPDRSQPQHQELHQRQAPVPGVRPGGDHRRARSPPGLRVHGRHRQLHPHEDPGSVLHRPLVRNRAGRRIEGCTSTSTSADATQLPGGARPTTSATRPASTAALAAPGPRDLLYAGCFDSFGFSASSVNPYAPLR